MCCFCWVCYGRPIGLQILQFVTRAVVIALVCRWVACPCRRWSCSFVCASDTILADFANVSCVEAFVLGVSYTVVLLEGTILVRLSASWCRFVRANDRARWLCTVHHMLCSTWCVGLCLSFLAYLVTCVNTFAVLLAQGSCKWGRCRCEDGWVGPRCHVVRKFDDKTFEQHVSWRRNGGGATALRTLPDMPFAARTFAGLVLDDEQIGRRGMLLLGVGLFYLYTGVY